MRGSPLVRALIAFIVILAAGYPLWRLTEPAAAVAPRPAEPKSNASGKDSVLVEFAFTRPPSSVQVVHLGEEVWSATNPQNESEAEFEIAYPPQGVEVVVQVNWPEGDLAAARIRLHSPAGETHVRSIWADRETTEVLFFP